jgi:hypothetical protein
MQRLVKQRYSTLSHIGKFIFVVLWCVVFSFTKLSAIPITKTSTDTTGYSIPSSNEASGGKFSPEQDSAYARDLHIGLNSYYWLQKALNMSEPLWKDILRYQTDSSVSMSLTRAFERMPKNIFAPLPSELVQYEINRINALSVPTVTTFSDNGTNFSLYSIGRLLGLVEDVSPTIKYRLDITADVEIVIYNVSAQAVATIFKAIQRPGKYTIEWNGKDDAGKKVPSGDYVAEVRVGSERFIRKRIVIGGY